MGKFAFQAPVFRGATQSYLQCAVQRARSAILDHRIVRIDSLVGRRTFANDQMVARCQCVVDKRFVGIIAVGLLNGGMLQRNAADFRINVRIQIVVVQKWSRCDRADDQQQQQQHRMRLHREQLRSYVYTVFDSWCEWNCARSENQTECIVDRVYQTRADERLCLADLLGSNCSVN